MNMNISSATSAAAAQKTPAKKQPVRTKYKSETFYITKKKEAYNKGKMLADVLDDCEKNKQYQTMDLIESVRPKTVIPFIKGTKIIKAGLIKASLPNCYQKKSIVHVMI